MDNDQAALKPSAFEIAPNTWGDKKFKLKNKFAMLSDVDLDYQEGREGELIARLQARLGRSEAEVHQLINEL